MRVEGAMVMVIIAARPLCMLLVFTLFVFAFRMVFLLGVVFTLMLWSSPSSKGNRLDPVSGHHPL